MMLPNRKTFLLPGAGGRGKLRPAQTMEKPSHNRVTYSPGWTLIPTHYCRNTCGYCAFVKRTGQESQLLAPAAARREIERARAAGATELLIMSGEGVESSPDIRAALRQHGFSSYTDYLVHVAREALAQDLLPHINIGNMTEDELRALRPFVPSMGMMLETTDARLTKEAAHVRAPDKEPERRIETLLAAGRARVPFTTGMLIGINESLRAREETLRAVVDVQKTYGHIQEVIIQPFTPHAGTAMSRHAPPSFEEMRDAVRMAREILPAEVSVQIPPNIAPRVVELTLAGARDLGGISPDGDRINPLERWLAPATYRAALAPHGFTLDARLAVHEAWATPYWLAAATLEAAARVRLRLPETVEQRAGTQAAADAGEGRAIHA